MVYFAQRGEAATGTRGTAGARSEAYQLVHGRLVRLLGLCKRLLEDNFVWPGRARGWLARVDRRGLGGSSVCHCAVKVYDSRPRSQDRRDQRGANGKRGAARRADASFRKREPRAGGRERERRKEKMRRRRAAAAATTASSGRRGGCRCCAVSKNATCCGIQIRKKKKTLAIGRMLQVQVPVLGR